MRTLTPVSQRLEFISTNPRSFYTLGDRDLSYIRENQQLPLMWSELSRGDIAEIRDALFAESIETLCPIEREARLAIECILTIGRSLETIRKLSYFPSPRSYEQAQQKRQKFGLIRNENNYVWILPQGGAKRARTPQKRSRLGETGKWIEVVHIAASTLTVTYFESLQRRRDRIARVFRSSSTSLEQQIKLVLKNRKPSKFESPRPISDKLGPLERHLANEIPLAAGGDAAEAIRRTDKSDYGRSTTAAYYMPDVEPYLLDLDEDDDRDAEPPTAVIKDFIGLLKNEVEASRGDSERHHEAFINYTVELINFCTAARGNHFVFPSTHAIDQATGFCQFIDKGRFNPTRSRLIWVTAAVQHQLKIYQDYLRTITLGSNRRQFRIYKQASYPTVSFPDSSTPTKNLRISAILNRSRQTHCPGLPKNVGRHWLRTHMLHQCSTETLHAFFGHHLRGMEPWSYGSCLDPLTYRADLKRILPELLGDLGWSPLEPTYP